MGEIKLLYCVVELPSQAAFTIEMSNNMISFSLPTLSSGHNLPSNEDILLLLRGMNHAWIYRPSLRVQMRLSLNNANMVTIRLIYQRQGYQSSFIDLN